MTLGELSGPEEVSLCGPDFRLRVESRGVLTIDMTGANCPGIALTLTVDKPVFVNGRYTALQRDPYTWN